MEKGKAEVKEQNNPSNSRRGWNTESKLQDAAVHEKRSRKFP